MTEDIDVEVRKHPHVLVTDGNYLMQRSNYAYKDLAISKDQHSGIVYGYIKFFVEYLTKYKPDYMIPLFDNGRSSYRTSISKHYKENRGEKSKDMLVQMKACREFLRLAGWTPYMEKNVEADDLAAKVSNELCNDYFVELLSVDHDWKQLTKENVIVIRPGIRGKSDEIVTHKKATEELGLPVERWPEIAAIAGDPGDGIYGLKGYGYKKALKLIKKYGNLMIACTKEPILIDNAATILGNYKMTILDGTVSTSDVPLKENKVEDCKEKIYDNDEVLDFCDRWHLASFKRQIKEHSLY